MRYRVAWTASSQQHLANVWLASHDRDAVTSASALIDEDLQEDPQDKGSPAAERSAFSSGVRWVFNSRSSRKTAPFTSCQSGPPNASPAPQMTNDQ